jgi:hypothetical protein
MGSRPLLALTLSLPALIACGQDSGPATAVQTASIAPAAPAARRAQERLAPAEVVGVMVHVPTASSDDSFERLGFAGTFNRTRLAVQVHHRPAGLIDLVRDDCTLEWFRDDRGTDLVDPEEFFGPIEMMPSFTEDGSSFVFVVGSKRSPHPEASRIEARGTLVATRASETTTADAEVSFAQGESFTVGPYTFEITETGESEWMEGWTFQLTSKADTAAIVRYALVVDGNETELQEAMSMSGGGIWHQSLVHESALERGTIRIEYWADTQRVELPFSVSSGLGLR